MDNEIFYKYPSSPYDDGILLNEYRNEFSLVAAKRKNDKTYMEWVFPQKRDGSKEPIDKSVPWKIKLGSKAEAIAVLKFFLDRLDGGTPPSDEIPVDGWSDESQYGDQVPF
ncbi:MAG: hypothetical protein KAV83_12905 [Desulfobacterales bacterium]|nr:hypothetical protein [Desulfobacterales bacterium]